jgi:hypothetical protein
MRRLSEIRVNDQDAFRQFCDEDEFITNPPPIDIISFPRIQPQCEQIASVKSHTLATPGFATQTPTRTTTAAAAATAAAATRISKARDEQHNAIDHYGLHRSYRRPDYRSYLLRLWSNILFLISSCLYLAGAVALLLPSQHEYLFHVKPSSERSSVTSFMIFFFSASTGFLATGVLECFVKMSDQSYWAYQLPGFIMVVAALFGIASSMAVVVDGQLSTILNVVFASLFVFDAIALWVIHESNVDRISCDSEKVLSWRRMADSLFSVGTIANAVLSFFYLYDTAGLPHVASSVAAGSCWVLASMAYLGVTRYYFETHKQELMEPPSSSSNTSCYCRCLPLFRRTNREIPNGGGGVIITVIEEPLGTATTKEYVGDDHFVSYCQKMTPNFDRSCMNIQPPNTLDHVCIGGTRPLRNTVGRATNERKQYSADSIVTDMLCGVTTCT